ncbi:lipopolysaccharide biosynthesis protein [Massilia sp. UMI-21]|nr:lipopolysaccharide biosynthesis protein [Massilia sp. UMI-21]
MKQQTTELDEAQIAHANEISVIDILIVLAKRKKSIFWVTFCAAALAVAVSLILPSTYEASTKVMPPQQNQSSASMLLSQLGGIAGVAGGMAGLKNPNDLYVGMLRSRTVADKLVESFDLKKVYDTKSQDGARMRLAEATIIAAGKDGLITISVEGRDQKLVAPMANAYVTELLSLTKVLAVTEAAQRRVFFERQLEAARDQLVKAERALKGGLASRGVISVDAESRAIVETIARLRAEASAKEIQLSSMRSFVTTSNPEYRRAEQELIGLRSEISKLENGRASAEPAQSAAGQSGLESIKILRDLKYHQMLYELLAKQYEVARLDEAKDPPIIQVLDPAIEPERRSKPRRGLIVILTTFTAFMLAILWAFFREASQRTAASPDGHAKLTALKSYLAIR